MTANLTPADQPFTIILDDDETNPAEGRLRKIDAGPTWAKHRVRVELAEDDTSGHGLDATSVSIALRFDDDVEGHALSLHFPTAQKADEFRKRLLATGIVAGALVVGVTAAQLTSTAPAINTGPIVAPAPVAAPAPVFAEPRVNLRIPAEDLAPGAPAKESPIERIRIAPVTPAAESPAERIREQTVAPTSTTAAESPIERIREQSAAPTSATAKESPAERIREQSAAPTSGTAGESPIERIREQSAAPTSGTAGESPIERIREQSAAPTS
ncbi:MAG: hypothetical protein ABI628_02760, partial [Chloroflexota bacterium]